MFGSYHDPESVMQEAASGLHKLQTRVSEFFAKLKTIGLNDSAALKEKPTFCTDDLHKRMGDKNVGVAYNGSFFRPSSHEIVMVGGNKENVEAITDLDDEGARSFAKRHFAEGPQAVLGPKDLAILPDKKAIPLRRLFESHIAGKPEKLFQFSKEAAHQCFSQWDPTASYQEQISYLSLTILAKSLFGLNELPRSFVRTIRHYDKVLLSDDEKEVREATQRLLDESNEITREQYTVLSDGFARDLLSKRQGFLSKEEIIADFIETKAVASLIAEENHAVLIMGAIAYVNQHPDIKNRLRKELDGLREEYTWEDIDKLPYLHCIYLEALRDLSPVALVCRGLTTNSVTLDITDKNGDKSSHSFSAPTLFLAPLHRLHHDPAFWENPETFNPSRFEGSQHDYRHELSSDHFMPFSTGNRACPAGKTYIRNVTKAAIVEFFKYFELKMEALPPVPVDTLSTRFHEDCFATVTPRNNQSFSLRS